MDFADLVRRVINMRAYGLGQKEVHDNLIAEGVGEDMIFFAWTAAKMQEEWNG